MSGVIAINSKSGSSWLTNEAGFRTLLVFITWLVVMLATFFCATFKWEWPTDTLYPQFLHWLGGASWVALDTALVVDTLFCIMAQHTAKRG